MPFSKQPVNSTYQTKQVQLVKELGSRGTSTAKDNFILNGFSEIQHNRATKEDDLTVWKRAGSQLVISSVGSGGVRGMFHWYSQARLFVAITHDIYVYNSATGALVSTLLNAFPNTTTGAVGFEEFLYSTGTVKVVCSDGLTLNTIDNALTVVAVGAGFPTPHDPNPVVIDGYLFLLKSSTADIYNSKNDDPTDWTIPDFITAELRPDLVRRIASLNNYLVAMGDSSIEYFYDAGNPTGSPFSKNDSATKFTGYLGGLAKIGGAIYFVGQTSQSGPEVFMMQDFKCDPIGTEQLRRHLAAYPISYGAICSFNGHDFYVITTSAATYVMDLETKLWVTWAFGNGSRFPMTYSTPAYTSSGVYTNFFSTDQDQAIYKFNPALGSDNGIDITFQIVTEQSDFDSYNRKVCHRLTIYSDRQGNTNQFVTVKTSDNDYMTWSAGQQVNLNQDLPCCYRMGSFRNRSHMITYTGSLPLRIFKIELDLNLGNT